MDQIALYYPYVSPPTGWLKQSLLMSEKLSSIVAPELEHDDPEWLARGDLGWLESEGVWTPTYVEVDYASGYRDEIETALLEFADNDNYRVGSAETTGRDELTPIYSGKLAYEITDSMVALGLARQDQPYDDWLAHREVAAIILAITAKYVAAAHRNLDSQMICSTDLPIFEKIAYDPLRGSQSRSRCLELLLDGLAPVPGDEVPFSDIISFREHHDDELGRFRLELARMLRVIRSSEDPFDEIRSMREGIRQSVSDLKRAARSRRIRLVAGSCSVLALGATAGAALHGETLHWVFDGFGVSAVATLMDRLVRGRAAGDDFAYLLSAQSAFGGSR